MMCLSANSLVGINGEARMAALNERSDVEVMRVRILPDGRLARRDAAKYLGVAEKTMAMWQMNVKGAQSVRVGGRRFYFQANLDAFVRGEPVG